MKRIFVALAVFVLFISSAKVNAAYAQYFKLQLANPGSSPAAGNTFDVKILINTAGKQSTGADAILIFDPNKMNFKSAATGNFYAGAWEPHAIGGTTNKYLFSAWQPENFTPAVSSTDTLFGTVTFNALASGSAALSFDCTSGTTDSNIWDTNQTDIINCANTQSLAINIGGLGPTSTPSATSTPGPTSPPAATATPVPPLPTSTPIPTNTPVPSISVLPRTGVVETTIGILGLGAVLTVVGVLVLL